MQIYLDLLPEERKRRIAKQELFLSILRQGGLFLLPIALFVAFLVGEIFVLKTRLAGTEEAYFMDRSQQKNKELKEYEDSFAKINIKTTKILSIDEKHIYWSNIVWQLAKSVPDGVHLIDLSSNNYVFSLVGMARTREDLLKFQDNLGRSECFQNINVPLSNLVIKRDVEFQIDFKIKKDCLENK